MRHTLVAFHAHPDDEVLSTGGTLARAAAEGHRTVVVIATRGELGEVPDGLLAPSEELSQRRVAETARAAEILGVARLEFLGYRDSGMAGTPHNHLPGAFAGADVEEAAGRLAALLDEERADVLTTYDGHGGYGHPDHVQVHRVGHRAARVAGRPPRVYEATIDRDHLRRLMALARGPLGNHLPRPDGEPPDVSGLGVSEHEITTRVDVTPFIDAKRRALFAHESQVGETHFFRNLPEPVFALAFGTEWFIRADARDGGGETGLFHGLP